MGLDSYLELFTTVYGWTIANLIYGILLDTGIVFIPLIVTIVAVWMEAHENGHDPCRGVESRLDLCHARDRSQGRRVVARQSASVPADTDMEKTREPEVTAMMAGQRAKRVIGLWKERSRPDSIVFGPPPLPWRPGRSNLAGWPGAGLPGWIIPAARRCEERASGGVVRGFPLALWR